MKTKVSPKEETRRSTANWEKEIEHYLFDTNLRWSFLHTKIINRMPIRAGDAEEYVNTIEKTKALLSAQQKKTEKMVLERVRMGVWDTNCKCCQVNLARLSKLSEMEEKK